MNQLTLRGFDDALANRIKEVSEEHNISLHEAALRLLRVGAGLSRQVADTGRIGHDLDHLIGAWRDDEAEAFLRGLESLDTPDESLWS